MPRRLLASLVLAATLALGACADPNSPVDPRHSPTYGVVLRNHHNTYGEVTFYYLRVRTNYGAYWVSVPARHWVACSRGEIWARALGCP